MLMNISLIYLYSCNANSFIYMHYEINTYKEECNVVYFISGVLHEYAQGSCFSIPVLIICSLTKI